MPGRDDDACLQSFAKLSRAAKIAALNDTLRRHPVSGRLAVTAGVIASGNHALSDILAKVAAFNRFDADNDPHGERDFGAFDYAGARLYRKVDYCDRAMRFASPDPADPAVTTRVLTVMLAQEY